MRFTASAFLGLALLLFGSGVWAQDNPQNKMNVDREADAWAKRENEKDDPWSHFMLEEVILRRADDPTLRSPLALPQPKLTVTQTDGEKPQVKARIGLEMTKRLMASLEVMSPKNSSGDTALATQDGLSNGTTAELNLSWFPNKLPIFSREQIWKVLTNATKKINENGAGSPDRAIIESYGQSNAWGPSAVAALGGTERYKAVVNECQKELGREDKMIPILTAKATASQAQFHFVNSTTLKTGDQSQTNWTLTASTGAYLWGEVYSALTYNQGKSFLAGRTANLCSRFGETSALECSNVTLDAPRQRTTRTADFEIRRLFGSFGLAAHLTRDLQANITTVEIPIYFLQKMGASDMELNSGVALRWSSDTRKFSVSAFIGPALSTVFRMIKGTGGQSPQK